MDSTLAIPSDASVRPAQQAYPARYSAPDASVAAANHLAIDPFGAWQLTPERQAAMFFWPATLAALYREQCQAMDAVIEQRVCCTDQQIEALMRRELAIQMGWAFWCVCRELPRVERTQLNASHRDPIDLIELWMIGVTDRLLNAPTLLAERGNPYFEHAVIKVAERLPECSEALSAWLGDTPAERTRASSLECQDASSGTDVPDERG